MEKAANNQQWDKLFKKQKSQSKKDNELIYPEKISSYIFIYDCAENLILYVNKSFEIVTGHSASDFNLDFLIQSIHPDDLEYFLACEERGLKFTNKLSYDDHFKYTLSYSYRIRNKQNEYIRILQLCQAIEVNNSGHLTKTFVTHKQIPYSDNIPENDYKIFDKSQSIYIDEENSYNLSKREIEVLQLIKLGYNSSQVADTLNISKNTILTHRKNILNKTNSNSFIELVKKLSYTEY